MDVVGNPDFEGEIVAESADFTNYELLSPGTYISPSRKVEAGAAVDKNKHPYVFAKIEVSELQDENGATITLNRPMKDWIATFPQKRKNQQGTSSKVADYLRQAGFEPSALQGGELRQALTESAQYPVKIVVGWTNMTKKLPDGTYTEQFATTKDFNRGTKDEPVFVPTFEKDGEVVRAKHRISFYKKVA
jgi:hypothetical protein